jgi:signal transduction histidine kinase
MTATANRSEYAKTCDRDLATGGHPLEMFSLFRRIPRSFARDLVYTLIWNTLIAAVFTLFALVFDPRDSFAAMAWTTFVIANCIGYLIHLEFVLGDRIFPGIHGRGLALRTAYYSTLPLFGVFAGYWLATELLHLGAFRAWVFSPRGALSIGALSLLISGLLLAIFIPRERAARVQAAFERERARVAAAEKQATQAQLKLLEAQVEPHFLYNTLANVVSLIDADPATAKRMLDRLIALLRGAAVAAGAADTTLAAQIEHLRAYLELMALRMGGRLTFRLDLPADLAAVHVPPLLLQPLVENAIRHGLEPTVGGGEVTVTARRAGDILELIVADTGAGFRATRVENSKGSGLGLSNLRERLAAQFGVAATLVVEDNAPAGARVTLRIPLASAA